MKTLYKFYVGGIQVDEPEGVTGMRFRKPRNERFGGMLQRSIGYVDGVGEVVFSEPLVVNMLTEAFREKKTMAKVPVQVQQYDGTIIIDGEINFKNFRALQNGWAVTIADTQDIEIFLSNADTDKELFPTQTKLLNPYELLERSTHGIAENLAAYKYKKPAAKTLAHPIPWKAATGESNAAGQYQSVTDAISPVWTNTTNAVQTVKIEGNVIVTHRAGTSEAARLALCMKSSGTLLLDDTQGTLAISTTATISELVVKATIQVPANADVFLFMDSSDTATDFSFTYDSKSYLYIGLDVELAASEVVGFTAPALLSGLSNMPITANVLSEYFITDGLHLRGGSGKGVIASFGRIWDDLHKLRPLILNWVGNSLVAENLETYIRSAGVSLELYEADYYETRPCLECLHSGIVAGFNRWQSETPTGGQEENAVARWNTPLTNAENLLNAECQTLTGSKRLIEKIRRKRYEEAGSSTAQDDSDDRQLVVIKSTGSRWNVDLTPAQIVENWRFRWAASGGLTGAWKEGGAVTAAILASGALFTGMEYAGSFEIDGADWVALGDVVAVNVDNLRQKVWVMDASYLPGSAGSGASGNLEIYGWVLV